MIKVKAFTLIELLVVIAIMSILTAMGVSSYVSSKNKRTVLVQAEAMKNIIAEAKSLSISPPTKHNDGTDINSVTSVEVGISTTPTVKIFIRDGVSAPREYRDYSGFDKVMFQTGDSIVFDNQGQVTSIHAPAATQQIVIQNIAGTEGYTVNVNKFGFANITKVTAP